MAEVSPEDELDAMLKAEGVAEAVPPEKAAAAAGGKVELSGDSQKLQEFADLMKKVPLLRSLAEEEQLKIAALLKAREFEDGENIIVQGEEGDCMYFIQKGELDVFADESSVAAGKVLATLGRKDARAGDASAMFFGEMALIEQGIRNA